MTASQPAQQASQQQGASQQSAATDPAPRYFTPHEVAEHNLSSDCWVSYFQHVYDLTPLIRAHPGLLAQPIIKFAGQDITHWFDAKTREPKTHLDEVSGVRVPYLPYGRFIHIPPNDPVSEWNTDIGTPWWQDDKYLIGRLSQNPRLIRIINVLTGQEDTLEVCGEESLEAIRARYLAYNQHAHSYTWKRLGRELDMTKTLAENGIADESAEYVALQLPPDSYIPAVHVYFNDDLTVS